MDDERGGLQYWTAVDLLKKPTGDSCPIQDMLETPDHTIWATSPSTDAVCQAQTLDPTGATIVAFPMPAGSSPDSIALGSDGLLWVTAGAKDSLLHIDLSGSVVEQFELPVGSQPKGIASAPDGSLWIALYGSASLAQFDMSARALISTTLLPSSTHPYALKAIGNQVCYLGASPNYAGCTDSSGKLLAESRLPDGMRDTSNRGQMTVGPDTSVWFSDSNLDLVRFDEAAALVSYSVGIYGAGIASKSDGIDFSFNAADGSSGISTFKAAFTGLTAAPSEVAEGGLFTLSGILTQLVNDPAPIITMPQAELSVTALPLPAEANIKFSQEFSLEAASANATVEALYTRGTHSASFSTALKQTNSPPSLQNLVTSATVVVGTETTMISGVISDLGTKDTFTVTVDWGDDWPPDFVQTSSAFSLSHTYFNAGSYTLHYTVADLGNASVSGTASVSAAAPQSATSTTLTASASAVFSGESVTLQATVKTSANSAPTGAVQFNDGATLLGSATIESSGVATLTTTSLTTSGAHSISAVYAGNAAYLGSASTPATVNVNPAIFAFSVSPSSQTSSAGASASYQLTITPSGSYTSEVSFSCAFLPSSSATCTAEPVTPGASPATTTLTISGALRARAVVKDASIGGVPWWRGFWIPLALVGLFLLGHRRNSNRFVPTTAFFLVAMTLCACGGASPAPYSAQTYRITITAKAAATASGSSAAMTLNQTVSLTVSP